MRRLLEMSNGPLENIRKLQGLVDRLLPPDLPIVRFLERIQPPSYGTTLANNFETLNRQSALFEATQSILAQPTMLKQLEALATPADSIQHLVDRALLPDRHGLAAMAERMAKQVELFRTAGIVETAWSQMLERQMAAVQVCWLNPHLPAMSFEGFAVVSRLGQAVRYAEPFDEAARNQIDEDLGYPIDVEDDAGPDERDAAHVEAGINAAMLAIAPNAVGDVLIQSGFVFKARFTPLPPTTDGSDPGHVFHPGHHMLITTVEQKLRRTIDARMQAQYGAAWMGTQIDPNLLQGWTDRREEAVTRGESPLALIQYSNFMELKDIVMQRQHWREVFEAIFKKKECFQTSMDRLHPIRVPLAHSRPIGIGQQYHLISEAGHILRALGVDIFKN